MKQNQSTSQFIVLLSLSIFSLLGIDAHCQQAKPPARLQPAAHNIVWDGAFGYSYAQPKHMYCLMGNGFFRAPTSANFKSLISGWLSQHPKAKVIPVQTFGPVMVDEPDSEQTYVWLVDGNDNLNEYLVLQGGCPGGTMLIPKVSNLPRGLPEESPTKPQMSKQAYALLIKALAEKQARDKSYSKTLISEQKYARFIKVIVKAEAKAQKEKRGIWKNGTDIE